MSASLQERRERVERRLEALLLGLDETVRQVYESLLERGADYDELTPEKSVARLEGFHDYIITREETGVAHPTFSDYIEAKRKFGDEMLSFGSGRHSTQETVSPVEEAAEELEIVEEFQEPSLVASEEVETTDEDELPSFLADESNDSDEVVAVADEEPVVDDEEEVEGEEVAPVAEDEVIDDNDDVEAEEVAVAPAEPVASVWEDDEDDVVIIGDEDKAPAAEEAPAPVADEAGFVAPVVEKDSKEESKAVAGRINERVIIDQEFSTKLGGYNIDEIDDYLDELAGFFKTSHSAAEYTAKAKDIEGKTFNKKNFKKGFAINEVDNFLDTVILELQNRIVEAE